MASPVEWARTRLRAAAPILLIGALSLTPHAARLAFPSLVGDDVQRIEDLQAHPLSELWFRPFNEHMAPIFETVSWIAWRLAGRRLELAPLAFTLASFLPFILGLATLAGLARRVFGSAPAAAAVVALFALSPAHFEAVAWYSASSFAWALWFTLLALRGSLALRKHDSTRAACGAALAAAAAPACSAIGLLAGPAAALAALPDHPNRTPRRLARAAIPLAGTAAYLALTSLFRYHSVLEASARRTFDPINGLLLAARGPFYLAASLLLGAERPEALAPRAVELAFFALFLAAAIALALRAREGRWAAVGLLLVLAGHGLTFSFRTWLAGVAETLSFTRYHLFPQLGLALILGTALRPWLARPRLGWPAALATALALFLLNGPEIRARGRWTDYPEQRATLAALDRLSDICRDRRISREQAAAALDPVLVRWSNTGHNLFVLLPVSPGTPTRPPDDVRADVLRELSPAQRGAIFGGMEAASYLSAADSSRPPEAPAPGRLVHLDRARPTGSPGGYEALRRRASLCYEFPAPATPGSALRLPGVGSTHPFQVWWIGPDGSWSPARSVTLPADAAEAPQGHVLSLARLPHWDAAAPQRFRLVFPRPGPIRVAGTPALWQ